MTNAEAAEHNKAHEVTIYVNTRAKQWSEKDITYEQLVALAFTTPPTGENVDITVTYRRGEGNKSEGSLTAGGSVRVKDGMIFDVTATDRS
ncbi:MAG: hypothetical protein QOH56_379 [Pseudonocardiales bacterium]|jgi:hypothetical protein|nr:hypothetical protein [Pseudonocardiales bacterium]